MEHKSQSYEDKITEEFPCFDFWFTAGDGCIAGFTEDNHGIGYIYGLPLNVVWDVVDSVKDDIEGNYQENLPKEGVEIINVRISGISYFGGQWSEDACAYEIHPGYWFSVEFKEVSTPKH